MNVAVILITDSKDDLSRKVGIKGLRDGTFRFLIKLIPVITQDS